jgi:hypothetical protein
VEAALRSSSGRLVVSSYVAPTVLLCCVSGMTKYESVIMKAKRTAGFVTIFGFIFVK